MANNRRPRKPNKARRSKGAFRAKLGRTLSRIMKKFGKTIAKLYKKSPLKFIGATVACLAIIILIIGYALRPAEQITHDGYTHADALSNCIVADGIDVSYAQGAVDWKNIKKHGIDFVFIRAGFRDTGEGNLHIDERFEENIHGAKKAGLAVGVYYFSQATTVKEAREEANYLLELVKPYDVDLPLMMDYEKYSSGRLVNAIQEGKLGTKKLTRIVEAWTDVIEDAGYDSGLYANYDFLAHYLDGVGLSATTNIWTAQYNSYAQFSGDYRFWQCTDSLQLEGTESTYVDRDFWYVPVVGTWSSNASDAAERTSISECTIEFKKHNIRYFGHNVKPKLKIKNGFRRLREGRDYTISYIDNTAPGTGYAVVRGIGKYKDTVSAKFLIKRFIF